MAIVVGTVPFLELRIGGELLDTRDLALSECTSSHADDEAALLQMSFGAEGVATDSRLIEGRSIRLAYGWDGRAYGDPWEGVIESVDPKFGVAQSITVNAYGPSFRLRDSNAPSAVRGTYRDAVNRIVASFGLTATVRVEGQTRTLGLKDANSAWEVLEAIARATNSVVVERGLRGIYIGPREEQEYTLEFEYRQGEKSVTSFEPHWTRHRRPRTVRVVGVQRSNSQRFEGVWNAAENDNSRQGEVTLYLPVRSAAEARERAQRIGRLGSAQSRRATLTAPIMPVENGQIVRVVGDELGRYAGSHYVRRVQRDHLSGEMTLELEYNQ
jgi:hypothetical protein